MSTPRARKTDHSRQIAAIREKFPALDAAVVAAQAALDAALLVGSDTRPHRGAVLMAVQARKKADAALQTVIADAETERQAGIVAAARAIEQKAATAREKLLKKFEFSLESPA